MLNVNVFAFAWRMALTLDTRTADAVIGDGFSQLRFKQTTNINIKRQVGFCGCWCEVLIINLDDGAMWHI
jgi:hypothetical protein